MATNFADMMAQERERLAKEREEIFTQQQELEQKLQGIGRELAALDAYHAAREGKPVQQALPMDKKRKGPAPGTKRGESTSTRMQILDLIKQNRNTGLTSSDIEKKLPGVKSISNALSLMKKEGQIQQSGRGQPWFPSSQQEEGDLERTPPEEAA